jgi:hypothetical protein
VFKLREKLFGLYDAYDYEVDPNKDSQGKGTLERYNELLGEEYDDNVLPKITGTLDNLLRVNTAEEKFLLYLEDQLGRIPDVGLEEVRRRKFIRYATRLYRVRGTRLSYELIFKLIGFDTVVITETFVDGSFDANYGFDGDTHTFDQNCFTCAYYKIELTGSLTLDTELKSVILQVVDFLAPLVAILNELVYNGVPVDLDPNSPVHPVVSLLPWTETQINVSWTDLSSNESAFELWYSTDGINFSLLYTAAANETYYEHSGLTTGLTYSYKVRGIGIDGEIGEFSEVESFTLLDPMFVDGVTPLDDAGYLYDGMTIP